MMFTLGRSRRRQKDFQDIDNTGEVLVYWVLSSVPTTENRLARSFSEIECFVPVNVEGEESLMKAALGWLQPITNSWFVADILITKVKAATLEGYR